MTFSSPSYHLVVGGSVSSPVQGWSVGLRMIVEGSTPSLSAMQSFVDACLPLTNTWINAINDDWSLDTIYNSLRLYYYPVLPGPASEVVEATVTPIAGPSNSPIPAECALVHTLQTTHTGRRYRGRIYVPFTSNVNMEVDGNVGDTETTHQCNATATWLTALNALTASHSSFGGVVVISQVGGIATPISSVKVDSKIDSQRRRERSLVAAHVATHTV